MATGTETCQFCETSKDIKFNCDDCNLLLCETCNVKLHSKVPTLIEHKVRDISNNPETENMKTIKQIDLKQIHCLKHNQYTCFAVCQKCEKSVCSSCLVKPNEWDRMNEIYEAKCEKLKEYQTKIEEDLPFFTENARELEKLKEERLEKYNDIKKQILEKEEDMKEKIAENAMALVKEVDEWWHPQRDEISKEEDKMKEAERDLKERRNIIEEALKSEKIETIIEAAELVIKDLPLKSVKEIQTPIQIKFSAANLKNLVVGSIKKIPKLKTVKSFDCDVTSNLVIFQKNEIMGYDKLTKTLKKFVLIEDSCYYVTTVICNDCFQDIEILKHGKILVTLGNRNIYEVKESKCSIFFSISYSWKALCIHQTENENIIFVGYIQYRHGDDNTYAGILTVTKERKQLQKYEPELNDERLIRKPIAITTNINGDICIIDTTNDNLEGRVIVLTAYGKYKWMYEGNPDSEQFFSPRGITITSAGQILVADQKANLLHMLSMDGFFLTSIGEADGIVEPISLVTDHKDRILVGCLNNKLILLEVSDI